MTRYEIVKQNLIESVSRAIDTFVLYFILYWIIGPVAKAGLIWILDGNAAFLNWLTK